METIEDQFLFVEKYRPQTIDECILPKKLTAQLKEFVKQGQIPQLMFTGTAGIGKTTVAKALLNELNADFLVINASKDGNIDTLRTTISQFASSKSLMGGLKIVILDEADHLNPQSTQPALRNFMEEFSKNCRFIFTANFPSKIIEPLHSRCTLVDFNVTDKVVKKELMVQFFKRVCDILDNENVTYEKPVIAKVVDKYFPDFRRTLGELQSHIIDGKIDDDILDRMENSINELVGFMERGEFIKVRKWVAENTHLIPIMVMRKSLDQLEKKLKPECLPDTFITYSEYDERLGLVQDPEITLMAYLSTILVSVEFQE